MDIIWTNHWRRFVVVLILNSDTNPVTGGCREQRKKQNICIWRACVGAGKPNRQPGKIQGRFFCGFPACPAEFAVPGDGGTGQCWAAQSTGSHPCSAPCSVCILGGSWRLKCPHQQGNNLPKAVECWGKRELALGSSSSSRCCLDFSLCLALQEWLQPLSAAPGLRKGDLK